MFDSFVDPLAMSNEDEKVLLNTAVRILQAHERARQGRLHAYRMFRMKNDSTKTEVKNFNESILIIQTVWRQKHAETLFEERKLEENLLLGMVKHRLFLFEQ